MLTHLFVAAVANRYQHKNNRRDRYFSNCSSMISNNTRNNPVFPPFHTIKFPLIVARVLVFPCSELNSQNQFRSKRLLAETVNFKIQDHFSYALVYSHTKLCPSLAKSTTVLKNASLCWPEDFIKIELQFQIYCLKLQRETWGFMSWTSTQHWMTLGSN